MVPLIDGNESTSLAQNKSVLNEIIYRNIINGQISGLKRKGFLFRDSTQIKIKGYLGYKLILTMKKTKINSLVH